MTDTITPETQKASEMREIEKEMNPTHTVSPDTQAPSLPVDQRAGQRIIEIEHELIDLEKRLMAGDKNAAGDLAVLLEEQKSIQQKATQAHQVEYSNKGMETFLQRFIGKPLKRLFTAMTAPDNKPLEALRTSYMLEMLKARKAAGKSINPFLTIPLIWKTMRSTPSELASGITNIQQKH